MPARRSPTHAHQPPQLQALREEFDDAIARGDLIAAIRASGEAILIGALQLSADANRWLDEVFLTDDGLCGSAADVLGTLLHEAGHALAHVRGVRDTSRQGRYHNARFKPLAEELGLKVRRDPVIGWSQTTLAADTATVYSDTLADLARALNAHRGQQLPAVVHAGGMLACKCGEWLRSSRRGIPGLRAAACGIRGAGLRDPTGSRTARARTGTARSAAARPPDCRALSSGGCQAWRSAAIGRALRAPSRRRGVWLTFR